MKLNSPNFAQVLYHGFDRVTDLVGHGKSIEAAAAACPMPPGPVQRDTAPWQGMHAAFVRELRAAEDAGVSDCPAVRHWHTGAVAGVTVGS